MRMRLVATLLPLPLLLLPLLAPAQLYRWVDDKGKVHYSDQAPPSDAKNVQKQARAAAQGSAGLPYALRQPVRDFPVTLYTSDTCKESCDQARALLDKRGVPYGEINVKDEADVAKLVQLSGGLLIPVMTVGREVYKGFESGAYAAALDTAGYPASSQLPPGVQARKPAAKPTPKPVPAAAEDKSATAPQGTTDTTAPK